MAKQTIRLGRGKWKRTPLSVDERRKRLAMRLEQYSMPEPNTGCVLWSGMLGLKGYGRVSHNGRDIAAHRAAYELATGQTVPKRLVMDHLCRVKTCVNPRHVEPVTNQVNVARGLRGVLKTHCKHGHPFIEGNLEMAPWARGELSSRRPTRACLTCRRIRAQKVGQSPYHRERKRVYFQRRKMRNYFARAVSALCLVSN